MVAVGGKCELNNEHGASFPGLTESYFLWKVSCVIGGSANRPSAVQAWMSTGRSASSSGVGGTVNPVHGPGDFQVSDYV